jgi:hypothetical protein
MPLFIGLSLLFLFDFDSHGRQVKPQNGPVEPKLSISESSFTG